MELGLSQNDLEKSIEAAPLFTAKLKADRLKTQKNSARKLRGIFYLSKSALFSQLICLRRTLCKKVASQPACLDFMMQFPYVIRHAHKIPFCLHIPVSPG